MYNLLTKLTICQYGILAKSPTILIYIYIHNPYKPWLGANLSDTNTLYLSEIGYLLSLVLSMITFNDTLPADSSNMYLSWLNLTVIPEYNNGVHASTVSGINTQDLTWWGWDSSIICEFKYYSDNNKTVLLNWGIARIIVKTLYA